VGSSGADVIVDDAVLLSYTPTPPSYSWAVFLTTQFTTNTALGPVIGALGNDDFEFRTGLIASDYRLFPATPGLEFTPSAASEVGNALVPGSSIQHFVISETKYYAYWADVFPSPLEPDAGDHYGWVALMYDGAELVITDSATAVGGGIIVGTYTQIPEPSSVVLFAFAAFGLYRRIRAGGDRRCPGNRVLRLLGGRLGNRCSCS
jgi:hypothetical protein